MTMTVGAAIARVRNYLDDQNNGSDARWSDSEIQTALELALDVLVNEAVQGGVHQAFRLTTSSTLSSGQIIVPANTKIISVFLSNSNVKTAIMPAGPRNRNFVDTATTGIIEIDYIAKNNVDFTNSAATVTYATVDIDDNVFDAYLCTLAAIDLSVKEGEVSPVLMDRAEKYRRGILGTPITGQISVYPLARNVLTPSSYYQLYYYKKSPTVLEVYR